MPYFDHSATTPLHPKVEKKINVIWVSLAELRKMVLDGKFNSSLQIALLALASLKGHIKNLNI